MNIVPWSTTESMRRLPRSDSTAPRTTSMPTPRPETSVTSLAVLNPGSVMSIITSASGSVSACSRVRTRRSRATRRRTAGSMPRPSSVTRMTTLSRSFMASSRIVPTGGFPFRTRSSDGSIPWSMALRRMWRRGSGSSSRMARSSSVSLPSTSKFTSLPCLRAKSRTARGNRSAIISSGHHAEFHGLLLQRLDQTLDPSGALVEPRGIDRLATSTRDPCAVISSPTWSIRSSSRRVSMRVMVAEQRDAAGPDGGRHTVGLKPDGTLWTWGSNEYGQLGNNTRINSYIPIQVGVMRNWVMASAGQLHTMALRSDGTLWAWGNNGFGRLGDNEPFGIALPLSRLEAITTGSWSRQEGTIPLP